MKTNFYFSDYFGVSPQRLQTYGAFNISLIADLPLFIDPFLLFNSFASQDLQDRLVSVELGGHDDWIANSDHMPLSVVFGKGQL